MSRIRNEDAWLLHHRPYRDASSLLEVMSREHGRLSLVARGSRSRTSRLRGLLRPFLELKLSWVIRSDLGTLTGAELAGSSTALTGDALLSGWYVNELLLLLLHRHDPQPQIYAIYSETVGRLAAGVDPSRVLREFEMELLKLLGYGINLDHEGRSHAPLVAEEQYEYRVEQGPVRVERRTGPMVFSGAQLLAVRERDFSTPETLRCAARLLRATIAYHLDGRELKSRRVLRDLRRNRQPEPKE